MVSLPVLVAQPLAYSKYAELRSEFINDCNGLKEAY
jgi:hypothetical protein